MEIRISYQCVLSRQRFALAFNKTRFSNLIWFVNVQNLGTSLLKLQMKIISLLMQKTGREYYILQIYGYGAYLNFFYRHQKIERYPFQLVPVNKPSRRISNSKYKHRTLYLEKPVISTKIK